MKGLTEPICQSLFFKQTSAGDRKISLSKTLGAGGTREAPTPITGGGKTSLVTRQRVWAYMPTWSYQKGDTVLINDDTPKLHQYMCCT